MTPRETVVNRLLHVKTSTCPTSAPRYLIFIRTRIPFNKLIRPAFLSFQKLRRPRRLHSCRNSITVWSLLRLPFFVEEFSEGVASPTCTDREGVTRPKCYTQSNDTGNAWLFSGPATAKPKKVSTRKRGELEDTPFGCCSDKNYNRCRGAARYIRFRWMVQLERNTHRAGLSGCAPGKIQNTFANPDAHMSSSNLETKSSGRGHPYNGG